MNRKIAILIWVLWTARGTSHQITTCGKDQLGCRGTSVGGLSQWQYYDGFDTKAECIARAEKIFYRREHPVQNKKDAAAGWKVVDSLIYECRPAGVNP